MCKNFPTLSQGLGLDLDLVWTMNLALSPDISVHLWVRTSVEDLLQDLSMEMLRVWTSSNCLLIGTIL